VRRRQSSIVSIIFSFFEIIRSLSLSFFAFCCCRESEREAPSKKKKIFADVKKITRNSQRFFLVLRHQFPPITLPNSIIGTKTAANQSRPKEELAFSLLKNDERNVHLSFSDGFLERNPRKDEKDARARKVISKPRNINSIKNQRKNN